MLLVRPSVACPGSFMSVIHVYSINRLCDAIYVNITCTIKSENNYKPDWTRNGFKRYIIVHVLAMLAGCCATWRLTGDSWMKVEDQSEKTCDRKCVTVVSVRRPFSGTLPYPTACTLHEQARTKFTVNGKLLSQTHLSRSLMSALFFCLFAPVYSVWQT